MPMHRDSEKVLKSKQEVLKSRREVLKSRREVLKSRREVLKSRREVLEKTRDAVVTSLKKSLFKFAAILAIAVIAWVSGQALLNLPYPHLFDGQVSGFIVRVLLLVVAFLVFAAIVQVKKIADSTCSICVYHITTDENKLDGALFCRLTQALRPFFYLGVILTAYLLFKDLFAWINPLINTGILILIGIWTVIAAYVSISTAVKKEWGGKNRWPLLLADDLIEVVEHISTPEIEAKEINFAYAEACKAADEIKKVRRLFAWKYSNLVLIALFVLFAYWLATSGWLNIIIAETGELQYLGAFLAGLLFTSVITVPIAIVAICTLATSINPYLLALLGGLGAMIGDYALFVAFKKSIGSSKKLAEKYNIKFPKMRSAISKVIAPIFAGFIMLSPLPDEIAIAILGAVHFNPRYFLVLAYSFNAIGILAIALAFGA